MEILIIIVIAFLILVYVYIYIKYKKRKSQNTDTVNEFHKKYHVKEKPQTGKNITKYNSSIDYIEKSSSHK